MKIERETWFICDHCGGKFAGKKDCVRHEETCKQPLFDVGDVVVPGWGRPHGLVRGIKRSQDGSFQYVYQLLDHELKTRAYTETCDEAEIQGCFNIDDLQKALQEAKTRIASMATDTEVTTTFEVKPGGILVSVLFMPPNKVA